jgi:hypothetical protein
MSQQAVSADIFSNSAVGIFSYLVLAGTSQTDGKKLGLVWKNRKKICQIINDYLYKPFFHLIILFF